LRENLRKKFRFFGDTVEERHTPKRHTTSALYIGLSPYIFNNKIYQIIEYSKVMPNDRPIIIKYRHLLKPLYNILIPTIRRMKKSPKCPIFNLFHKIWHSGSYSKKHFHDFIEKTVINTLNMVK